MIYETLKVYAQKYPKWVGVYCCLQASSNHTHSLNMLNYKLPALNQGFQNIMLQTWKEGGILKKIIIK